MNDTVAVVGLGRMGSAMAHRDAAAGYDLVVWNRNHAKAEAIDAGLGERDLSTIAVYLRGEA